MLEYGPQHGRRPRPYARARARSSNKAWRRDSGKAVDQDVEQLVTQLVDEIRLSVVEAAGWKRQLNDLLQVDAATRFDVVEDGRPKLSQRPKDRLRFVDATVENRAHAQPWRAVVTGCQAREDHQAIPRSGREVAVETHDVASVRQRMREPANKVGRVGISRSGSGCTGRNAGSGSDPVDAGRELVASCRRGLTRGHPRGPALKLSGSGERSGSRRRPDRQPGGSRTSCAGAGRVQVCSTNHRGEGSSLTAGWASVRISSARSDAPGAGASLRRARLSGVRQQACQRLTQRRRYYPVAGCAV